MGEVDSDSTGESIGCVFIYVTRACLCVYVEKCGYSVYASVFLYGAAVRACVRRAIELRLY